MNTLFSSIIADGSISAGTFFACTACSILVGMFIARMYMRSSTCTRSFAVTLALLPAIVQLVIMLVNGNIGAGVAVAGAFSLVRFRSAAGRGQEILCVFLSMAVGLATGMGYLMIAIVFAAIVMCMYLVLSKSGFGAPDVQERVLKVTVPETLDFEGIFDDIFAKYTSRAELSDVRTSSMGSLYRLSYRIWFRREASYKEMIDEMRQRNGNLEISCARPTADREEEL